MASLLVSAAFGQITYNAPTSTAFIPYGTIPNVGGFNGANTLVVPPEFPNAKIIRITDLASGGQSAVHNGYTTSCDTSSEEIRVNLNKDRVGLCQLGNFQQLWGWNFSLLTFTRDTSYVSPGVGSSAWSFTQPYALYHSHLCPAATTGCTQNDFGLFSYDTTCAGGIATCNPPATLIADISTACNISALQANSSAAGGMSPSGDDQTFGGGFTSTPGQGSSGDIYVVYYTRAGNCGYWRTDTGQVYLNGVLQGTIGISDRFTIHNVKMGKGGTWIKVSESGCISGCTTGNTNLYWQIGTLNVTVATFANTCGHTAAGYNSWVNKCNGSTNANGLFKSAFSTPNTNVSLPNAYPSPSGGDQAHINWAADNSSDTMPFFVSMEDTNFAGADGWDNTLLAVATDGSGNVWQLAHHYVAQINAQAFIPIAGCQDATCLLFTSDWNQTLGCTDGLTLGCGLNNPDWVSGTVYTTASIITPLVGNAGPGGGIGYSYSPTANCTAGSTEPSPWIQTVNSGSSNDNGGSGGCTWVNRGAARTEVFMLLPQVITNVPCISACSFLYADGEPSDNGMLDGFVR